MREGDKVYLPQYSNPVWSNDNSKIYFIRVEIPHIIKIREAHGFDRFNAAYTVDHDFDPSRLCIYKLIELTIDKNLSLDTNILMQWQLEGSRSRYAHLFLSYADPLLILKEPLDINYPIYRIRRMMIDSNTLEKEIIEETLTKEEYFSLEKSDSPQLQFNSPEKHSFYSSNQTRYAEVSYNYLMIFDVSGAIMKRRNINYFKDDLGTNYMKLYFSPDFSKLFVSGEGREKIFILDVNTSKRTPIFLMKDFK